ASLENAMMNEEQLIFLSSQKEIAMEEPEKEDIYKVGTVAKITQMIKLPNGTLRVLVEGLYRAEIIEYLEEKNQFEVKIAKLDEMAGDEYEEEALMRQLLDQFSQYIKEYKKITIVTLATLVEDRKSV